MAEYGIDSFIGWHRDEPGRYYAFTRVSPALDDIHNFECWELVRSTGHGVEGDSWDPGWHLYGPDGTWGEYMGYHLADAQSAAKEYIRKQRTPKKVGA